jgi:hypothetical protein
VIITACDRTSLAHACSHDPAFDCSPFPVARARLARPARAGEDPFDATEGTCGTLRYLQYRVDPVPSDQQEALLITQFYDASEALVAARVATNHDSTGAFAAHSDWGPAPSCTVVKTATVNPAKERAR